MDKLSTVLTKLVRGTLPLKLSVVLSYPSSPYARFRTESSFIIKCFFLMLSKYSDMSEADFMDAEPLVVTFLPKIPSFLGSGGIPWPFSGGSF